MTSEDRSTTSGQSVAALRGPAVAGTGRRLGLVALGVFMVGFAVVIVVGFLTAAGDNARITRMKTHGIPVSITVSDCIGNLGGSGSSAAGYTCRGTYAIDTQPYDEVIGGLSSFSSPGTTVKGVADPSRPSTVVLSETLARSRTSANAFVVLGLLAIVFLALLLVILRRSRRQSTHRPESPQHL